MIFEKKQLQRGQKIYNVQEISQATHGGGNVLYMGFHKGKYILNILEDTSILILSK